MGYIGHTRGLSSFIRGIARVTIWDIGLISLLTMPQALNRLALIRWGGGFRA